MSYFYNKFQSEALNKAYELLESVTPLSYDCGAICSHKCCNGSSDDGMLLLPGEEELFCCNSQFTVYYSDVYKCNCVSCNGSCNREMRPLSCRIFPYFLYVTEKDGTLIHSAAPDVRALEYCPLLNTDFNVSKTFLRALRLTSVVLCRDEKIKDFLIDITLKLTDFGNLK